MYIKALAVGSALVVATVAGMVRNEVPLSKTEAPAVTVTAKTASNIAPAPSVITLPVQVLTAPHRSVHHASSAVKGGFINCHTVPMNGGIDKSTEDADTFIQRGQSPTMLSHREVVSSNTVTVCEVK